MEQDHTCSEFDQLMTCIECGAPKNETPEARRSGGLGASMHPTTDEEYMREMDKLMNKAGL